MNAVRRIVTHLVSSRVLSWGLGITISILSLYFAFRGVDYMHIWETLVRADMRLIALALVSVAVNTVAKSMRWKVLLGKPGRQVSSMSLLSALLVGQMLNNVIPARVGDLSRAYMIGNQGSGKTFVLGTVALEKVLDMVLYTSLFLILALLMPVPAWVSQPIYPFTIIALSSFLTTTLVMYNQDWLLKGLRLCLGWLPHQMRERVTSLAGSGMASLDVLRDWRSTVFVACWSAVIWGTAVLTNYLVLLALAIDAPPPTSLFVLIVLQAGIAIPSVPGKIGIFEYLCVLSLAVFGIHRTPALSYGVLLHMLVLLPTTVIGIVLLWTSGLSLRRAQRVVVTDSSQSLPSQQV